MPDDIYHKVTVFVAGPAGQTFTWSCNFMGPPDATLGVNIDRFESKTPTEAPKLRETRAIDMGLEDEEE